MIKILLILCFFINFLWALSLTKKEKDFLKNNPVIILGGDRNWKPYVYLNQMNQVEGYEKDLLDKINILTGANFQITLDTWEEIVKKSKEKKIDGLVTSVKHEEREKYFNFTNSYLSHNINVLVKHGNPLKIKSINDLKGKTIVVQNSNLFQIKLLKKIKDINILYKNTTKETLYEVMYGEADATIGIGANDYLRNDNDLPYLTKAFILKKEVKQNLVFSIRKDWPEAISILNKALKAISNNDKNKLYKKWFNNSLFIEKKTLGFTNNELEYIKKKKTIRICTDPTWHGFSKFIVNDKNDTLSTGFLDIVLNKANLSREFINASSWENSIKNIKNKKCDLISAIQQTDKRSKFINFTSPYISYPLMINTHIDTPYMYSLKKLENKTISILKAHAAIDLLKIKYPNLNFVYVNSAIEGLKKVKNKEVYAYIELMPGLISVLKEVKDIKINRELDIQLLLSMGIRDDDLILHSIIEKVISSLSIKEKNDIFNKLIDIANKEKVNYDLVIKIFILFFCVLAIVVFFNYQLKKRIKIEINKNKEQESLLHFYSKQDAMGNLIANISHQWKQPIDELSSLLLYIETKMLFKKKIKKKDIKYFLKKSRDIIEFLSDTVDTFNNFYKHETHNKNINIESIIDDISIMLDSQIRDSNTKIIINNHLLKYTFYGSNSSMKQVLFSIVNNSCKIALKRKISSPYIKINIKEINNKILIEIEDNCGGIKENINNIFDLTKSNTNESTGLGLFISNRIIEDKFKGNINAENTKNGVKFNILIPYSEVI